jgi:hypothetical protein
MPQNESKYHDLSLSELEGKARQMGISGHSNMKKDELIKAIEQHEKEGGSHSRNH